MVSKFLDEGESHVHQFKPSQYFAQFMVFAVRACVWGRQQNVSTLLISPFQSSVLYPRLASQHIHFFVHSGAIQSR